MDTMQPGGNHDLEAAGVQPIFSLVHVRWAKDCGHSGCRRAAPGCFHWHDGVGAVSTVRPCLVLEF
jgi:hypothetical protein